MIIYQLTEGLDPRLKISGCYFMSILKIFEKVACRELSVKEINAIFAVCVELEYVDSEAYIKKKAVRGMAQVASGITGSHVYMKLAQAGKQNFSIAKFTRTTSSGKLVTHFVLMDGDEIAYDPYSKDGSRTARTGRVDSYRYIFAEVI